MPRAGLGCRRRSPLALAAMALRVAASSHARADTRVSIAATSPSDGATLALHEAFHVRLEYVTDEPVRLWARPYAGGKPVSRAMTPDSSGGSA